ncbi:Flp family type IVb pilin [Neobacillus sp. WH10]|uniref:Flp family type IVb pilin n=1 Tax=Neobacillus sp. WH10 TaxID=3047873 RepID=UPI0024C1CD58|nr:Flp family type IVb pilin [Neobacillus sp. WH10]WHY76784.1 Flp family type IVb pilin [Neobacillus sp. WH10]
MIQKMRNLVVEEEGQALTEYGLIIALVSVLLAGSLILFKEQLAGVFTKINGYLNGTTKS